MAIRKKLFQNGISSQAWACPPNAVTMAFNRPISAIYPFTFVGVNEFPYNTCTDKRYGHGHEYKGFYQSLPFTLVGQYCNDNTQDHAGEGSEEHPEEVVSETFQHNGIGECEGIIIKAYEFRSGGIHKAQSQGTQCRQNQGPE